MSNKAVITLNNVTKMYGTSLGVKNISLSVNKGEVFGFLGPNGAGKSTTINMMVDLMRPSSGVISIFGLNSVSDSVAIRQRMGFLAGDIALDRNLNGWQQLEYFARIKGDFNKSYIKQLAERLDCDLAKRFKNLSRGNKQKIGLIAALMHKPDLLILDEPTSGLDPLIQQEFNKLIMEQKQRGATTFISSHVLSEVQQLCQRIGFIRDGQMVAIKTLQELSGSAPKQVKITGASQKLISNLKQLNGIGHFAAANGHVSFTSSDDVNKLLALVSAAKIDDITISESELDTIFMHYYEKDKANV